LASCTAIFHAAATCDLAAERRALPRAPMLGCATVSAQANDPVRASRAAARRRWWPGQTSTGGLLAVLLMCLMLATPFILLFIVVLAASMIHRFG
jgi:hypothetical protein